MLPSGRARWRSAVTQPHRLWLSAEHGLLCPFAGLGGPVPSSAGSSPASPQLRSHLLFCPVDKEENMNLWKANTIYTLYLFCLKSWWTLKCLLSLEGSHLGCHWCLRVRHCTTMSSCVCCQDKCLTQFIYCLVTHWPSIVVWCKEHSTWNQKPLPVWVALLAEGNLNVVGMGFPSGILFAWTKIICRFSKLWWVLPDPLEISSAFSFLSLSL